MSGIGKIAGTVFKTVTKNSKAVKQVVEHAPKVVSNIETNTVGRILRMQDAKAAFTLNNPNYVINRIAPLAKPKVNLVTTDNFAKRLAEVYPAMPQSYKTMSTAEKIATLQKRSDARAAFSGDLTKVIPRDFFKLLKNCKEPVKFIVPYKHLGEDGVRLLELLKQAAANSNPIKKLI